MVFLVGCDNETAASDKATEKSFEAQKIREGLDLFNSLDYKGAIELCDEISALKLNTVAEYNLRGEYLVKVGEYHYDIMNSDKGKELLDLAIRDYDSAIQLAPNDVDSYINRGNFYCKHGNQDLAIKDYNKALELDPKNFSAYKGRAMVYSEMQEYEQAIEELNKCIEIYHELNAVNLRRHCDYLIHQGNQEKKEEAGGTENCFHKLWLKNILDTIDLVGNQKIFS